MGGFRAPAPSLPCPRPGTVTPIRAFESAAAAIADQSTRGSKCQSIAGAGRVNHAAWANCAAAELGNESSSTDNCRGRSCARTTSAGKRPRAVEIAPSATTASSRAGASWLLGFRLALTSGSFGFGRSRTGQRLFVVADAAAGRAGLRERGGWTDEERQQNIKKRQFSSISHEVLHRLFGFQIPGLILAARSIGADRANNPARFASSAAVVEHDIPGLLHGVALNQRP